MSSKRVLAFLAVAFCLAAVQTGRGDDKEPTKINPDWLFYTTGHRRSAEPSEPRVYPAKPDGSPDRSKLPVWTGDKEGAEYRLKANEATAFHKALDITSRVSPDQAPSEMPFKAGVYGTVAVAKKGEIVVKLNTGSFVVYKHNSECDVKIGDKVTPTTPLGKTGNIGSDGKPINGMAVHLHIQAVDARGRIIDPDQAFLAGRKEPKPKEASLIKPVKPEWVDVGPIYLDDAKKRPRVKDGVVKADAANKKLYYDESTPKLDLAGTKWAQPRSFSVEFKDNEKMTLRSIYSYQAKYSVKDGVIQFKGANKDDARFTVSGELKLDGDQLTGEITTNSPRNTAIGQALDEPVNYYKQTGTYKLKRQ